MRIQTWHEKRLKERHEYARAHEEISLAQRVADFVVDRRVARRMTQSELAELAGTTQATISLIENGEGNPRLDTLARILTVLKSPPKEFGRVLATAASADAGEYGVSGVCRKPSPRGCEKKAPTAKRDPNETRKSATR